MLWEVVSEGMQAGIEETHAFGGQGFARRNMGVKFALIDDGVWVDAHDG